MLVIFPWVNNLHIQFHEHNLKLIQLLNLHPYLDPDQKLIISFLYHTEAA